MTVRVGAIRVLAQPRSVRSVWARVMVATVCIGMVLGVLVGEVETPQNVTFGGFTLIAVLAATWLLPAPYHLTVTAAALATPPVSSALGAVDPLTAKFQISAIVVAAVLAVLTVRSLRLAEFHRQQWHDNLMRFTADAAHELRTPLALMRATLEHLLRHERSVGDYQARTRTVLSEVDRMIAVSNSLLFLAQSDAGVLSLNLEPAVVKELVDAAVERFRLAADEAGVTLTGSAAAAVLECDVVTMGRLLDNLIDNAIRHTPRGGTVRVEAHETRGGWELSVQDSGSGIPEALRSRLFERFSRARTEHSMRGAGLGLSLCAAIAKTHGGRISLDQTCTTGTRIVLHLPATRGSA